MIAAPGPRAPSTRRLLHIDTGLRALEDRPFDGFLELVRPGDVWVINDAATLPASLAGSAGGRDIELRLVSERPDGRWRAVVFGEGSWRDDTDLRPPPPPLDVGDVLHLGGSLRAEVVAVDPRAGRLLCVRFFPGGDAFWRMLYAVGRPIQYSYLAHELALGQVQTSYAGRPWSVEPPSAGMPLRVAQLRLLRESGAEVVALTHGAGLSATGDRELDALLPLPERYELPARTARVIQRARVEGRRVVAVGTSTTRALEGNVREHGALVPGVHETDHVLGSSTERRVVDALLTGAHDPASSHYRLLLAFAAPDLLDEAVRASERLGYLGHELGDSWLLT